MNRDDTTIPYHCITAGVSDQGRYGASLTFRVPTNWVSALEKEAHHRAGPHDDLSRSHLAREALQEWFENHRDELTEETLDSLDEDLKANAGGDEA